MQFLFLLLISQTISSSHLREMFEGKAEWSLNGVRGKLKLVHPISGEFFIIYKKVRVKAKNGDMGFSRVVKNSKVALEIDLEKNLLNVILDDSVWMFDDLKNTSFSIRSLGDTEMKFQSV